MKKLIWTMAVALMVAACGTQAPEVELETLDSQAQQELLITDACGYFNPIPVYPNLDLNKYLGTWYELGTSTIVRNTFERGCSCTRAEYQLLGDGSGVSVRNTCRLEDGRFNPINGSAKFTDRDGVFGVGFPEGDSDDRNYFVMDIITDDEGNYDMVLVGDPCRLFMWILARRPTLETNEDHANYQALLNYAESNGYNTDAWYVDFQQTEQASCGWDAPKCEEVIVDSYTTGCQYFWQGCGGDYAEVSTSSCKLGWWDFARTGRKRSCERRELICQ